MPRNRALAGVYVALVLWAVAIALSLPGRSLLGVFDLPWWLHALTEAAEWIVFSIEGRYSSPLPSNYLDGAYGAVLVVAGVAGSPAWILGALSLWVDRGRRGWSRRGTTVASVVFWPITPVAALLYHSWQTRAKDDRTESGGRLD